MADTSRPMVLYYEATAGEVAVARARLPQVELMGVPAALTDGVPLPAGAERAEVLSVGRHSSVAWSALRELPRLRLVVVRAASVYQVDLDACAEQGIRVANVPHFGEVTVAEHTFALLLALSRRLLLPYQRPAGAIPSAARRGWDLAGKTIGIVGLGHIGRRVAKLARAFDMRVLAYDTAPDPAHAEAMGLRLLTADDLQYWARPVTTDVLAETIEFVPLDDLLGRADVVTLHATSSQRSRHLIDAAAIARMRPGVVLINTARGGLVDLAAVRAALDAGRLTGVALDVVEGDEPNAADAQMEGAEDRAETLRSIRADLLRRPNVVISPHNAYNSVEALERSTEAAVQTIAGFMRGEPVGVVDPSSW